MNTIIDEPNQNEKTFLPGKLAGLKYKIDLAEEKIQRAKFILFLMSAIALFNFIVFAVEYGFEVIYEGHIIYASLFLIYAACAFLSIKKPLLGISLALIFYLLFQIVIYFLYGINPISSPISKGVTLFFLITGFVYCFKTMKMKKDLESQISKLTLGQYL